MCEKDITTEIKGNLTILRLGELCCIFRNDVDYGEDVLTDGKMALLRGQKQLKELIDG